MKINLVFLFFINISIVVGQSEKELLINDIRSSMDAYNNSDFDTLLKYFPDFILENISKDEMNSQLSKNHTPKKLYENLIAIDTIITIGTKKYARLYLPESIPMDPSHYNDKTEMDYYANLAIEDLRKELGAENVFYDKDAGIINYISNASYAIKSSSNWTFCDLNELTEKYIPIEIRQTD